MHNFMPDRDMLTDHIRVMAYQKAIERVVTDKIVLDVGSGLGLFAMIAAASGAKHVYAIDPRAVIQIGRQTAKENGLANRITFIEDYSQNVMLPQKADVMISELRGILPIEPRNISAIRDAKKRLLAPDARLIPYQDQVYVAGVSLPNWQDRFGVGFDHLDFTFNAFQHYLVNTPTRIHHCLKLTTLMKLPPQQWVPVDYSRNLTNLFTREIVWDVSNAITNFNAFLLWFDAQLYENIGYTSQLDAPDAAKIYGYLALPLAQKITLQTGDTVKLALKAVIQENQVLWEWQTSHIRDDKIIQRFQQNNLQSVILSWYRARNRNNGLHEQE